MRYWKAALLVATIVTLVLTLTVVSTLRSIPDLDVMLARRAGPVASASQDIHLNELPPHLVEALISAEDRNFYGNFGAEPLSMLRALYADIRAGRIVQGGSTISEQLAKNLLPPQRSRIVQKIREIVVVLMLEHRFSKDRILELYLNRVYFGGAAYGIEAAARRYFGKSARELTLYEAAMLVGLLPAPSFMNPLHDPGRAERRAQTVLQDMVEAGYLTPEERRRALASQGEVAAE
ncbi:hypothetical protein AU467_23715 [Mesorhizobium loti]|uniref:Glycosyl transferase family 51 domain-containing protein n=1 Tax=Rhizobium loti TaxID=381 RepID=A0A101KRW7_RHILI|nr:hypothetical protein AU467_23715 [Mesorhizobium loti]